MRSIVHALALFGICGIGRAQSSLIQLQTNIAFGLQDSSLITLDGPFIPGQMLLTDIHLAGVPVTLELAPFSIRQSDFALTVVDSAGERDVDPGDFRTMRGSILEDPDSVVAGSLLADGLHARIRLSSGDDYWLEPLTARVAGARSNQYVLYHNDDVLVRAGTCGTGRLSHDAPGFEPPPGGSDYTMGMHWTADLGVDSDFEYFQKWGSKNAVKNRIELIINTMNVQFERDVNITHRLTKIIVRTTLGTYTSTFAGTLLFQFRAEWNTTQKNNRRDVAHLFTGKDLDGTVNGVAYVGVVCNRGLAYSLVQSDCCGSLSCSADLSAHQLGHNWNAGDCNCGGYTMNASLSCANRFHPIDTIPGIKSFRNTRGCLDNPVTGTILFEDDFESGAVKSGWNCSVPARCSIRKRAAYNSAWGVALTTTVTFDRTVNTLGYAVITIICAERSQNYDLDEYLTLEWYDGFNWNLADQWQQKGWAERFVVLSSGAGNKTNFAMRFACNAQSKQERSKIDNVVVVGR